MIWSCLVCLLLINFVPAYVILYLSYSLFAQVSYPYNTVGNVNVVLCIFSIVCFLEFRGI